MYKVFDQFITTKIYLSPKKFFLIYPTIHLLGQRINAFGLFTAENKLRAIAALKFLKTLIQLKTYFGITGYLRYYVKRFILKVNPLKVRKAALNKLLREKNTPAKGLEKKKATARLKVFILSLFEIKLFKTLQKDFSKPSILIHYKITKILFYDID